MVNSRTSRLVLGLFVVLGLVASACGSDGDDPVADAAPVTVADTVAPETEAPDETAPPETSPPAETTSTEADEMVDEMVGVPCEELSVAALAHFIGPYTQQLMDGAQAAADECGASIQTGAPAAFDTQASLQQFNDVLTAGVDAAVIVAFPQDVWIRPIDDAVEDGTVVSTYDVESPASLQSLHTAPKQKDQGRVMAQVLAEALGSGASGTVVSGICLPGLALIEARVTGFKEEMAALLPDVEVLGPFDVSFDQTENFARWQDLIDNNSDALGNVGFCENDLPSLVRIKEADEGATYEIASIGVNPDGLQGIADGTALAAIGQKPFMQGYVAMRAMLESLTAGDSTPRGWIDVQPELITIDNVAEIIEREQSLSDGTAQTREFYASEIDAIFGDLGASVLSFGELLS